MAYQCWFSLRSTQTYLRRVARHVELGGAGLAGAFHGVAGDAAGVLGAAGGEGDAVAVQPALQMGAMTLPVATLPVKV